MGFSDTLNTKQTNKVKLGIELGVFKEYTYSSVIRSLNFNPTIVLHYKKNRIAVGSYFGHHFIEFPTHYTRSKFQLTGVFFDYQKRLNLIKIKPIYLFVVYNVLYEHANKNGNYEMLPNRKLNYRYYQLIQTVGLAVQYNISDKLFLKYKGGAGFGIGKKTYLYEIDKYNTKKIISGYAIFNCISFGYNF